MTNTASAHQLVIEPGLAERHYWRDLWRYRELFYVLAWRDVAARYKQTIIGLAWALLQPYFFEVQQGETLGIIGRNDAGKSTLLKILSRITEPTKGRITLNGRVASLLGVGTGFTPN